MVQAINVTTPWCFFDLFLHLVHFVIFVLVVLVLIGVHFVILVLRDLPSDCLVLASSPWLLVLGVLIDSLHHDVVPVLRIDPVVVVDVVLEGAAQDPPLAQKCKK